MGCVSNTEWVSDTVWINISGLTRNVRWISDMEWVGNMRGVIKMAPVSTM